MFSLFHGTTMKAYKDISRDGFFFEKSKTWSCSLPGVVYLYDPGKFYSDYEDYSEEEKHNYAFNDALSWANENAQIQNAVQDIPDNYTVVLELVFKDDSLKKYFSVDSSCSNSDYSVQINAKVLNNLVKEQKAAIVPHYYPFATKMSLVYIAGLVSNPYFQEAKEKFSAFEQKCLDTLSQVCIPFEDFFWVEEISNPDIKSNFR